MVAHFWNKKRFENFLFRDALLKPIYPTVWRLYFYFTVVGYGILFNPGPEEIGLARHVILCFAGLDTSAAANAPVHLDSHTVRVELGVGAGALFLSKCRQGSAQRQNTSGTGDAHQLDERFTSFYSIGHGQPSGKWG